MTVSERPALGGFGIRVTHIYRPIDAEWVSSIVTPISHPPINAPEIRAPPDQAALDVCSWGDCVAKVESCRAQDFSRKH
jgi:hypothetical protein